MLAGYANYVDVAIQNPSPSAELADFPLPLRVSVPTAHLQFADCRDVRVTSADGLDTAIPYGLKTHATSGGNTDLFILCMPASIPSGSGTVLTLRLYYNNPSAANGENRSGVCDSSTLLNMPLGGSGLPDTTDWTGNNSPTPTNVSAASGNFGGAASFDGSSSGILLGAFAANVRRMSCWFNSANQSSYRFLAAAFGAWEWSSTENGDGKPYAYIQGAGEYCPKFLAAIGSGAWKHLSFAIDSSAGAAGYADGSADGTNASVTTALPTATAWNIGRRSDGYFFDGAISDFKVETSARSPAWDYAEYAYGLDSAYLSQGPEQSTTPPPRHGGSIFQAPQFACPQFTCPCMGD